MWAVLDVFTVTVASASASSYSPGIRPKERRVRGSCRRPLFSRRSVRRCFVLYALVGTTFSVAVFGAQEAPAPSQYTRLQPSVPVTRDMSGSEAHEYRISVRAGQALHVVAQQLGMDVVVTASAPDGAPIVEMDSPNGANGPESVWIVAAADGEYAIRVRPLDAASRGRYGLHVETLRDATGEDRSRVELQDALLLAQQLSERSDAGARLGALENFKRAAAAARRLKDNAALSAVSTYLLNLDPEGTLQSAGLPSAPGHTPVYHSRGSERQALDVRERLAAPMKFFESKLRVRPPFVVAILTRADWTQLTAFPLYG